MEWTSLNLLGGNLVLSLLTLGLLGTSLQLFALTRQVFVIEASLDRSPLSPFNLQLMTMALALIAVHVCFMIQIIFDQDANLPYMMTFLLDLFSATFEFAYVRYSWTRASVIITRRVDSFTLRIITFFVKICPFILYAQAVPALFDSMAAYNPPLTPYIVTVSPVEQGLSAFAGICLLCFDISLLVGFARKNHSINQEMSEIGITGATTARGAVIVKYGAVSSCIWICVVMVYAGSTLLEQFSFQYYLTMVFLYWGSLGTLYSLYRMKVVLFELHCKENLVFVSHCAGNNS